MVALSPLGVRRSPRGHLFRLRARARRSIGLSIREAAEEPLRAVGELAREGDDGSSTWQLELPGLPASFEYVYRVDGGPPLIDPYARALAGGERWGDRSFEAAGERCRAYRALHLEPPPPSDRPPRPRIEAERRLIYEAHLRGFTRHPSSRVAHPGTYLGLTEKIPYLIDLGVTTVELLPIFEFDETDNPRIDPTDGRRLLNTWGYMPLSFFAPKAAYAVEPGAGREIQELRHLVDELHRAGIELVLDVVFNHTGESFGARAERERVVSLAGLDRKAYFLADAATGEPLDLTGCGNTLRSEHPAARRLVLDALRYWAEEIGVDGFRFDLAGAFFRGGQGEPLERSELVEEIAADPVLAGRLLIAEPWDATGRTVEGLLARPWRVWNGHFRDDVRRVVRGDAEPRSRLALRLAGSSDVLPRDGEAAVNLVTAHDGFTLADLVSYEAKRNLANGEENRDGTAENLGWNCGVEGPSDDPEVNALRRRQRRNFLALLLLARGTPMLVAGDELGRTQLGNNNAWCQDTELSWLDWSLQGSEDDARAELRALLELRRALHALPRGRWGQRALEPALVLELPAGSGGVSALLLSNPSERRVGFTPKELGVERGQIVLDSAANVPEADTPLGELFWLQPWSLALIAVERSLPRGRRATAPRP